MGFLFFLLFFSTFEESWSVRLNSDSGLLRYIFFIVLTSLDELGHVNLRLRSCGCDSESLSGGAYDASSDLWVVCSISFFFHCRYIL